jgi:hypothetical protein
MRKLLFVFTFMQFCIVNVFSNNLTDSSTFDDNYNDILNDTFVKSNKIPKFICNFLNEKLGKNFKLSKKINKTDVGGGINRGGDIQMFTGNKYFILKYEHGGIGLHIHVLIFKLHKNSITNYWNLTDLFNEDVFNILKNRKFILQKNKEF